jgi:hypothetical protein
MSKRIVYLTYQSFPAETANSIQSIANIIELVRQGNELCLVFPNREINSSNKLKDLQKYYGFRERFEVFRLSHPLPFGRINKFNKLSFHLSHLIWSFFVVNFNKNTRHGNLYITRSDWIFLFLSLKKKPVIFECHAESKLRKMVMKFSIKNTSSKVVFVTRSLQTAFEDLNFNTGQDMVLDSGYRSEFFKDRFNKNNKQVVFVGNLLRFGKSRDIEFIVECFSSEKLKDFTLKIVGGPEGYVETLRNYIDKMSIDNIQILGRLNQQKTSEILMESSIGILINSKDNKNSLLHTSPLKYFEYLAANLNVVAVDFQSHKNLPISEKIVYFKPGDKEQFIESILYAESLPSPKRDGVKNFSYENRIKKLLDFARLEGLEPPTL